MLHRHKHLQAAAAAHTGEGQPDFGVVGADAAGDSLTDASLPRPHLHSRQLLAQLPRAPCLRAQKLYQLPARAHQGSRPIRPPHCDLMSYLLIQSTHALHLRCGNMTSPSRKVKASRLWSNVCFHISGLEVRKKALQTTQRKKETHCELEMTKPKMMMPNSIRMTAMICSKALTGPTSPYPTCTAKAANFLA